MEIFATSFIALYVAHHVGDYWVQTDAQARAKGGPGWPGRAACLGHVISYVCTQAVLLAAAGYVIGVPWPGWWTVLAALAISGVTHYLADRREHGLMVKLARRLLGKVNFLTLGVPRWGTSVQVWSDCDACAGRGVVRHISPSAGGKCWDCGGDGQVPTTTRTEIDVPTLGTGAWALDQSWHILLGCFVPALVLAA